jgi:hypothetical protein
MKVQYEILLFIFILNLVVGLIIVLQFPGTGYVSAAGTGVNASEYEAHFNSTDITGDASNPGWGATPFSGIPVIGDIFGGWNFLIQDIGYLIDGFPTLLTYIRNTYITDADGLFAFDVIANLLRCVYALLISLFLIEFISGRVFSD